MAEKRRPGFNIPLNFYDGPEVQSIPRRIRAAAAGVWALAGNYAATQLTDGFVPADVLRQLGCTDAIRAALMVTVNVRGELSPLWEEGRNGGIQFKGWAKHQRTNAEVTAYRANDAERKRDERSGKRNGSTSPNSKTSDRTSGGQRAPVRSDARDPKTETKTETDSGYLGGNATDPSGLGAAAATPGADLVREVVPRGHPPASLTSLRLQASELLNTGTEPDVVRAALQLWCEKPGLGIGRTILASLTSEVLKTRTGGSGQSRAAPAANGHDAKVADFLAFANQPSTPRELER